jgi:hypothetical protein
MFKFNNQPFSVVIIAATATPTPTSSLEETFAQRVA